MTLLERNEFCRPRNESYIGLWTAWTACSSNNYSISCFFRSNVFSKVWVWCGLVGPTLLTKFCNCSLQFPNLISLFLIYFLLFIFLVVLLSANPSKFCRNRISPSNKFNFCRYVSVAKRVNDRNQFWTFDDFFCRSMSQIRV